MLRIFIQDSLFSSPGKLLSTRFRRSFNAFYSPFEYGSRSHNISSLKNYLPGLSISLSSLALSSAYRFSFPSLWYDLNCDSNSQHPIPGGERSTIHYSRIIDNDNTKLVIYLLTHRVISVRIRF